MWLKLNEQQNEEAREWMLFSLILLLFKKKKKGLNNFLEKLALINTNEYIVLAKLYVDAWN